MPRGFAFVEFEDADAARKAVELDEQLELEGRELKVRIAADKSRR